MSAVIKNTNGSFEIRGWDIYRGWTYWGEHDGGYWWSEKYRRHSTKYETAEQAIERAKNPGPPKPKDVKVWP